jgi:hypothetical protein
VKAGLMSEAAAKLVDYPEFYVSLSFEEDGSVASYRLCRNMKLDLAAFIA